MTMTTSTLPPCPKHLRERRGRHFVVVGGGRTGAASARLLVREGARVTVVDDGQADAVLAGLQKHGLDTGSVTVVGGGIDAAVVASADVIVLSPGVPRAHAAIAPVVDRIPIVNELEVGLAVLTRDGADLAGVRIQGITGTNGKSTTTTMAGAIATAQDPRAFVGGNLGLPLCAAVVDGLSVGTAAAPRPLVVELSSYQLETLTWFPIHAGTITNLTPDHLDRYPDVDAYYAAKARLFGLVTGGISLNAADPQSRASLWPSLPAGRATCHFDVSGDTSGIEISTKGEALVLTVRHDAPARTITVENPFIVGHHNRQNAAAAVALAVLCGVDDATILAGLRAYGGIAHRLERVGVHRGVTWWNDSKATNVDASVIALRSFERGVHLILGGTGKGAPYAPLVEAARGRVARVYLIGQDAPTIRAAFAGEPGVTLVESGTLTQACADADAVAVAGEHIVLSPACASFDQFRDYTHRGAVFRDCFKAATSSGAST
jgi:UDP-N-acetylmuramoylalanine--D-glutamate ligase